MKHTLLAILASVMITPLCSCDPAAKRTANILLDEIIKEAVKEDANATPANTTRYEEVPPTEITPERPRKKTRTTRPKGYEIPAYLTDRDEEILVHEGFTVSYNKKHLVPNWVAWMLTKERTNGTERRADNFQPDETIVHGPIAEDTDYRGSGYDRGHMCPAADCKYSREAMNQCFLLSNICPQHHSLNAGDWKELEEKSRKWANKYDTIYIVCGPVIKARTRYQTIGANKVMVPTQFFKVFLRWDGKNDAESIGFIYNNDDSNHPMSYYACSVDDVEALTGINFFSKLPRNVERKSEATYNLNNW